MRPAARVAAFILASSAAMAALLRPMPTVSAAPASGPSGVRQQLQALADAVGGLKRQLSTQQGQLVPVGGVVAFWGRRDEVPAEYAVCDGTPVAAADSPLHGRPTPDLTERFIQGAAAARGDVRNDGRGFAGGENSTTAFATQETALTLEQIPSHPTPSTSRRTPTRSRPTRSGPRRAGLV